MSSFIPKFRQSVIAGMGFPDEGKLTTELAYLDIKKAFEYYLTNENKGRPFILAVTFARFAIYNAFDA